MRGTGRQNETEEREEQEKTRMGDCSVDRTNIQRGRRAHMREGREYEVVILKGREMTDRAIGE